MRRYVEHVMGMPISLALRGRHAADAVGAAAWAAALDVLRAADRVFSTYRADSVICRLGRGEIASADCPPSVAEVLALGEAARRDSGGAFDVWRGGVLDPSGVVKGWAAERAAERLRSVPDTDFCLSAGGDIACRTLDPDAPPWRIGIEDPHDTTRLVAVIPVRTGAVATSGDARRGGHIVDARTGMVASGVASVTVVGDHLGVVDIDATAAFARGADAVEWLRGRGHRSGVVVDSGGAVAVVRPRQGDDAAGQYPGIRLPSVFSGSPT